MQAHAKFVGLAGRVPLGGDLESNWNDEDFMLADAYTLTDDLTVEPTNPDSIRNCVAAARESARQVRHTIANSVWSCLNLAYLDLRDIGIDTIWNDRPGAFYRRTESAMYRDEAWDFLRLGRFIERTQLLAALLEAHLAIVPTENPHAESDWRALPASTDQ